MTEPGRFDVVPARTNRWAKWATPDLVEQYVVLRRRCWNGEGANVYPLLKEAGNELLTRGVVPGQIGGR